MSRLVTMAAAFALLLGLAAGQAHAQVPDTGETLSCHVDAAEALQRASTPEEDLAATHILADCLASTLDVHKDLGLTFG